MMGSGICCNVIMQYMCIALELPLRRVAMNTAAFLLIPLTTYRPVKGEAGRVAITLSTFK